MALTATACNSDDALDISTAKSEDLMSARVMKTHAIAFIIKFVPITIITLVTYVLMLSELCTVDPGPPDLCATFQ